MTAQRVAAHRLTFDRVPAPWGDPEADECLARDVAGAVHVRPDGLMVEYLRARTAFFDRVVVAALERGIRQVVTAAAGYDARAWRYGRAGVRWFELDHPDTQADKVERLARLGIDTSGVTFIAADFATDDVAARATAAGVDPRTPGLFLCEGVAVYLDLAVLASLLTALRALAAPASRLAISLSVDGGDARQAQRRRRFRAAVAAMGEPARSVLTAEGADDLFRATRWQATAGADRARLAGLVVAEAV